MKPYQLPPEVEIGHVTLRVPNLAEALEFYAGLLGFQEVDSRPGKVQLSASGTPPPHLVLLERPSAPPRPPGTTGLFHLAVRFPGRRPLAQAFRRLLEAGWPFQGFSDHGVSEALYLSDPFENGVELYVDRPRKDWPRRGDTIAMVTEPLDVDALLAVAADPSQDWPGIHPLTDMGHVHLQVSDLGRAMNFYHGLLGLDITQKDYPGALFLSAGGYHHHLGLNLWAGRGAPPPPVGSLGVQSFSLRLPRGKDLMTLVARMDAAFIPLQDWHDYGIWEGLGVYDPDGILVELLVRARFMAATDRAELQARVS